MPMLSTNRPLEIAAFLDQHGWGTAAAQPFDGDFSPRRYARLTRADGTTAILMDADENQKTAQFISLSSLLRNLGLNAPEIYAALPQSGLVLLQDFGKYNIGMLADQGVGIKAHLLKAVETLAHLHGHFHRTDSPGLDLPLYTTDLFITQSELFVDEYIPFVKHREASEEERKDFRLAWRTVLRTVETLPKSLMLRDFMPDNLMDLSFANSTVSKIGILDFQDAGVGPIAYDLASLCEEVRREGAFTLLPELISHYLEKSKISVTQSELMRACTILSAQRHIRVLGIIAQLAVKQGRREKIGLIPRILRHLNNILIDPCLLPVQDWMNGFEVS